MGQFFLTIFSHMNMNIKKKHYWQYDSFLICSEFWNQFIENQTNLGSNMNQCYQIYKLP